MTPPSGACSDRTSVFGIGEPGLALAHIIGDRADQMTARPLSIYIHVPFCAHRCGYCDFNTYLPSQLGDDAMASWCDACCVELQAARRILPSSTPPVSTIFFGGGTPTLVPISSFTRLITAIDSLFGIALDAEITTEANPETLDAQMLDGLLDAGVNRLSMGMQSAVPGVLKILDRTHSPDKPIELVRLAHQRGFRQVSLDLIYGTPTESLADWQTSLDMAIAGCPEHISAYSLVIEHGTPMGRMRAHGLIHDTDDDTQATMYTMADTILSAHGYSNYEISNWAKEGCQARHNLAYWHSDHWWGIGPGAHSHLAGIRWWNHKLPGRYARSVLAERSGLGVRDYEILTPYDRHVEQVMLELRLASGLRLDVLSESEAERASGFVKQGLLRCDRQHYQLTLSGRLIADTLIAQILDDPSED